MNTINVNDFIRENTFLDTEKLLKAFAEVVIEQCALKAKTKVINEFEVQVDKQSILDVKTLLV